jgi:glycosyltransferase involved in cell wall biosynthesis
MRILQINKFFHARGGADTFFFKTCDLLSSHGHEIGHFSTRHPRNAASPFERYFVDGGFTEDDVARLPLKRKAEAFFEGIYSKAAYGSLRALVADFQPDLAHVHNLNYQLSPSIFDALRDTGIPSVVTLHDYSIVCGAGTLFVEGQICERCKGGRHYNLLLHGCYHGFPASLMATISKYVHDWRGSWGKVSVLISPSQFLRSKLIDFGVPQERIAHLPIFIDFSVDPNIKVLEGDYVLYFGRFSSNKGIETLLKATETLDARVVLIGDGPMRPEIERQAQLRSGRLQVMPFTSSRSELQSIIAGSAFVVVPSIWYENQPAAILESFSMGKPVIASRVGGIPELVDENATGLLFDPGNAADLRAKIDFLLANPHLSLPWGEAAKRKVPQHFSRDAHYAGLMEIYAKAMSCSPAPVAQSDF